MRLRRLPGQPGLHENAHHPVPRLDAADARADLDNLARAVRQRNQRQLDASRAAVLDGHQIAVIQRRCPHLHPCLPRLQGRFPALRQFQVVDSEGVANFKNSHNGWFLQCLDNAVHAKREL